MFGKENKDRAKIADNVTVAYSVYEALEKDKGNIISPEDFLDSYCNNHLIFEALLSGNSKKEDEKITEEQAKEALERGYGEAEQLLADDRKFERFLQRLEKKLKIVPYVGERLANVPILAAILLAYKKKEYTDLPIGTIIAIASALIYFVSPIDFVPDSIPFVGYFDDAAVVALCWKMVENDAQEFILWREAQEVTVNEE